MPFLRIGLANVVVVYLLMQKEYVMALVVTTAKTLIGGLASLTLMSPATLLSLGGGIGSLFVMWLLFVSPFRFSTFGISIAGAVMHNVIQIFFVRWLIIPRDSIYYLLPILMLVGIGTGFITGLITFELNQRMQGMGEWAKQSI